MEKINNITPGEILLEEFLKPLKITAYRLSKDTGMPATRASQILKGKRRITADTALRLSQYFGNSADFWMGIQDEFDLREEALNKLLQFPFLNLPGKYHLYKQMAAEDSKDSSPWYLYHLPQMGKNAKLLFLF